MSMVHHDSLEVSIESLSMLKFILEIDHCLHETTNTSISESTSVQLNASPKTNLKP